MAGEIDQFDVEVLTHVIGHTATGKRARRQVNAIKGSVTNDAAAAGDIGECISSEVGSGAPIALVNGVAKTITSIALTPGDWDVRANGVFFPAATTNISQLIAAISNVTDALNTDPGRFNYQNYPPFVPGATFQSAVVPSLRISLNANQTLYLVQRASFTVSTMTGFGILSARRVR